jgi:hypothetical protein
MLSEDEFEEEKEKEKGKLLRMKEQNSKSVWDEPNFTKIHHI